MQIYIPESVQSLRNFYGDLLYDVSRWNTITEHLETLAMKLAEGIKQEELSVVIEINNYNKGYLGKPADYIFNQKLGLDDARTTIAHEYGFKNWNHLELECNKQYNIDFENLVNELLHGNLDSLKSRLASNPDLLFTRSQYNHKATLLHYVGNNGVELWRQVIPSNLLDTTRYLLEAGADVNAKMDVYNGKFRTRELFESSIHPYQVEFRSELLDLL